MKNSIQIIDCILEFDPYYIDMALPVSKYAKQFVKFGGYKNCIASWDKNKLAKLDFYNMFLLLHRLVNNYGFHILGVNPKITELKEENITRRFANVKY